MGNQSSTVLMTSKNDVWIERRGKVITPGLKTPVYEGDILSTGKSGRLQLLFGDGTIMSLSENSSMGICAYENSPKNIPILYTSLHHGYARFISGKITDKNLNGIVVETNGALAVPHGGSFSVQYIPGQKTTVTVVELNKSYPVHVTNLFTNSTYSITQKGRIVGLSVFGKKVSPLFSPSPMYMPEKSTDAIKVLKKSNKKQSVCGDYLGSLKSTYLEKNKEYFTAKKNPTPSKPGISSPPIDGNPVQVPPVDWSPIEVPPIGGGPGVLPPGVGQKVYLR